MVKSILSYLKTFSHKSQTKIFTGQPNITQVQTKPERKGGREGEQEKGRGRETERYVLNYNSTLLY